MLSARSLDQWFLRDRPVNASLESVREWWQTAHRFVLRDTGTDRWKSLFFSNSIAFDPMPRRFSLILATNIKSQPSGKPCHWIISWKSIHAVLPVNNNTVLLPITRLANTSLNPQWGDPLADRHSRKIIATVIPYFSSMTWCEASSVVDTTCYLVNALYSYRELSHGK